MRRAEQRGRGQRIAQQPLQRRAGQAENGADRKPQNYPRQPDFAHDHLLHVAAAAEQGIDHGHRRQPHRSYPERCQREQHDKQNKRGHDARAPVRRDVSRHHDVLNAHQSSSSGEAAPLVNALTMIEIGHKRGGEQNAYPVPTVVSRPDDEH